MKEKSSKKPDFLKKDTKKVNKIGKRVGKSKPEKANNQLNRRIK
ncbi:hypothetical protein [uncultured Bacteroides sp.]|nr:hypothetical protein [uncultured Bacteroides sp.]